MKRKTFLNIAIIFAVAFLHFKALCSEDLPSSELARDKETLNTLLPEGTETAGWKPTSSPEFFGPQNLWEYIDGQAELYLDYGFKLVLTTDYTSMDGAKSLSIEIFQMESPDHAFGIYAAERSPQDNFIKMGVQGYLGENILNFWKGPYYVKLTSFQSFHGTKEILLKLAGSIEKKIKGGDSEPELFACFPEKNRAKMSGRFIPKNFLGQRFLKDGYRVEYKDGRRNYQIILVKNGSREEAEDAFIQYRNFFRSQGEDPSPLTKDDYALFFTRGKKIKVIFHYGFFMGGVLESKNLSEAQRIIDEMVHKLRNRHP
ncbi:MAG: DUF6599 family protein [Pseudomonadota bacterium]